MEFTKPLDLELPFSDYSLLEIESLFSTLGDKSSLNQIDTLKVLPVVKKFTDLRVIDLPDYMLELEKTKVSGFTFGVLSSQGQYNGVSKEFSNCVSSMYESETFILVASKGLNSV